MNDQTRSAAKRRASFARAERLAREAANQTERKTDARSRHDQSNSTAHRLKQAIKAERRRDAP
ncbi:hypothetical protein SAZ10_29380 [Mesorhizobium sp. BAC0120]|uniref:hypothetical protein n=1 Tax=Mesorhizobium sp. BAC0120 TaxID=3090670 RepID=UPI00298C78BF|nr:hypothetical protein [Mesorhizobium sp. BAC0120]MDW6025880.1 hypothetical protein [Mesorhizobium sp. BAC0120]